MRMHVLVAAVLGWLDVMASGTHAVTLGRYLRRQVGADTARLRLQRQGPIFTSATNPVIVQR